LKMSIGYPTVRPRQPGDSPAGGTISKFAESLVRLNKAQSATAAGHELRMAVAGYGYDHIALSRTNRGVTTDVPWNWMPHEFAEAYFTQDWEKQDPELYYARRTHFPFTWTSLRRKMRLTSGQLDVINAAADFGLHDGLCIPLRGTDGHLDLISLSSSQKDNGIDPAHRNSAAFLALRALARYIELNDKHENANRFQPEQRPDFELDDLLCGPFAPFNIPPQHLRALSLVEAGARRWKLGLTKLASRLYLLRACHPYDDLQRWGFIADETDDVRWRFYFKPSVLGLSYLRRWPDIERVRREIWLNELDRSEVPDGLEAE
jgi:Autoinducer binding domain